MTDVFESGADATGLPASRTIAGDAAMQRAGAELARYLMATDRFRGAVIALRGQLGAGKTTLCRGFITACGHQGAVKSPTYTLIEEYHAGDAHICHLDLYRLEDPDEIEYIGFRDLLETGATLLIEWPERVPEISGLATLQVDLDYVDSDHRELSLHWRLPASSEV